MQKRQKKARKKVKSISITMVDDDYYMTISKQKEKRKKSSNVDATLTYKHTEKIN